MDFLEDLFELGKRKRRKSGGVFQNERHHDHGRLINIQPTHIPRFLQTLRLFRQVSFAASVPRKLCKAQNFATAAEQPLR